MEDVTISEVLGQTSLEIKSLVFYSRNFIPKKSMGAAKKVSGNKIYLKKTKKKSPKSWNEVKSRTFS